MRLISADPELVSPQISGSAGIANGRVYYILSALVEKSFMKFENSKKNALSRCYVHPLTPKEIRYKPLLIYHLIHRKCQEYEGLNAGIEALKDKIGNKDQTVFLSE
jgi:hypothetical protein